MLLIPEAADVSHLGKIFFFLPSLRLFIFSFLLFVCVSGTFISPRWETLSFYSICSCGREAFLELVQSQELCSHIAIFLLVYLNAVHFNVVHLLCGAPNFDMASVVPDRALPRCTTWRDTFLVSPTTSSLSSTTFSHELETVKTLKTTFYHAQTKGTLPNSCLNKLR